MALKSKTEDPKQLLMRMFYRYDTEQVEKYVGILKIILHEHLRNEEVAHFFASSLIVENERRLDFLLVQLIENRRIAPVNHRYYAKILNGQALAMALEYAHLAKTEDYHSADRILMDEILEFIIDMILKDEGLKNGEPERNLHRWVKHIVDNAPAAPPPGGTPTKSPEGA